MPHIEESWQPIADTLGFKTAEEMLRHLYNEQRFSLSQIADIVGYSRWSVRRRLVMAGVVLRRRGGANNVSERKLKGVSTQELFDETMKSTAARYGVHMATVYLERQRRRRDDEPSILGTDGQGKQNEGGEDARGSSVGPERE